MNLNGKRVLITGAGGGIGQQLSQLLAGQQARLGLLDRNQEAMTALAQALPADAVAIAGDITDAADRSRAIELMQSSFGGIDVLINLAGILDFKPFADSDADTLTRLLRVNVEAPMQLVRETLPLLTADGGGRVVNIGSMFGSIGFPCFAAYSASKFALRGFSQALRRELADTGVGVTYISPRAVRTPLNPEVVHLMAERGMMHMDEVPWVAKRILKAVLKDRDEVYLGFPESLFARINGILPRLVDKGIAKQVPDLIAFAQQNH